MPCAYYANEMFSFVAQPLLAKLPKGSHAHRHRRHVARSRRPSSCRSSSRCSSRCRTCCTRSGRSSRPGLYQHEKRFAVPLHVSVDPAVLRRRRLRLLLRVPGDVPVLRRHHAQGRGDDDGHHATTWTSCSRCSSAFGVAFEVPVAVVLLVVTGMVTPREARRTPRLRAHRHLRHRRDPHAAGCHLPVHHGHPDVPAVRGRASSWRASAEDAPREPATEADAAPATSR